jgi:hypothetical protein
MPMQRSNGGSLLVIPERASEGEIEPLRCDQGDRFQDSAGDAGGR